ncbi:hypothetical protein [Hoeflea sp.]|uniref:hypothetical protein n=1 Tax=Hoeflea sp. TaxID=1940281 RepID=UPI003B52EC71
MAEPPKSKRPSRSRKTPKPDFSPFEDWLIDGPAGKWTDAWETDKELSERQKQIVADSAALLLDHNAWREKVQAFEEALLTLPNEISRKVKRARYCIRFDRHVFADGHKFFAIYPFPCSVSFSGAMFGDGDVSFFGAKFGDGTVSFTGAKFGDGDVSFDGATFGEGTVSFTGAKFGDGTVSFSGARFGKGTVSFTGATFGDGTVSFDVARFGEGDVSFSGARFGKGNVLFRGAKFGDGTASFDGATFGDGTVSFDVARFGEGDVSFDGATFGDGTVSFTGAKFGFGTVSFTGAKFGDGTVSFTGAKFGEGNVWFTGATFGDGTVSFTRAKFGDGTVSFNDIDFRSTTMPATGMVVAGNFYVKSHFPEAVDFSRLDVQGTASFSGSSFQKVPDFRDAKFDRPPEVAGMVVPRPKLIGWNQLATDKDDVAKFRKLKSMALAANDHEKDGEFFAGEMLAKRGTETKTLFGLLFSTLYWWLSDFGQSYLRPIGWLFVSYLIFAAACLYKIWPALTLSDRLWFAAEFSFRSLTPLFGSLFRFAPAPEDHVSWYQKTYKSLADAGVDIDGLIALGVAQSVIGTVFLFLLLLALRNKFRLK